MKAVERDGAGVMGCGRMNSRLDFQSARNTGAEIDFTDRAPHSE